MKKLCIMMVIAIALVSCLFAVAEQPETTVRVPDSNDFIWCFMFDEDCSHTYMTAEFYCVDQWGNETYKLRCLDCGGYAYVHAGKFVEVSVADLPEEELVVVIKNSENFPGSKPKVEYREIEPYWIGHYINGEKVDSHTHLCLPSDNNEGYIRNCTSAEGVAYTMKYAGEYRLFYCSLCGENVYAEVCYW